MIVETLFNKNIAKSRKPGQSPLISLAKTLSWRLLGTLDTLVISYWITGQMSAALKIGGIELFTKMALYFFHERAWNKIQLHIHDRVISKYKETT